MAKQGINIIGTDASPHMLAACRHRCADEGIHPVLHLQTMQQLDLDQQFAMIFIADGTFDLLVEDEDVQAMLEGAYKHLAPGGVLAFDFYTPPAQSEGGSAGSQQWSNWVAAEDGTVIFSRASQNNANQTAYDRDSGIWQEFRVDEKWADGKLIESEGWVARGRFHTAEMVEGYCNSAGFEGVRVTSQWEVGPAEADAEAISLTCIKPR
jgi:hypothetical protein